MYILCLCNHFLFVCDSLLIILVCFFMHLNPLLYVLLFFDIIVVSVLQVLALMKKCTSKL